MSPILTGVIASGISGNLGGGNSFESIATQTVGGGGASSITFSSIPSTYKHLQIRGIGKTNRPTYSNDNIKMQFNGDTSSSYYSHQLVGDGSTAYTNSYGWTAMYYGGNVGGALISNNFGAAIIDILDYASTNKFKVSRTLAGFDNNNNGTDKGVIALNSGHWRSTSAITSVTLSASEGTGLQQYTTFALYGIKE
jgi:hypothetical protein